MTTMLSPAEEKSPKESLSSPTSPERTFPFPRLEERLRRKERQKKPRPVLWQRKAALHAGAAFEDEG